MRKSIIVGTILAISIILCSVDIAISPNSKTMEEHHETTLSDYAIHDPISIISDDDFETQGWPGNGTVEFPYVLENLTITQDEMYNACITIRNTTVYYEIRNCFLDAPLDGNALYIREAMNGRLENCVIMGSKGYLSAIYCEESLYLVMNNCTIIGGVRANDCDEAEILNCTIYNTLMLFSSPNTLVNNCELFSTSYEAADISGDNSRFFNCNITSIGSGWGLRLRGQGSGFHVSNISISGVRRYGIVMSHISDSIIENCRIDEIGLDGAGLLLGESNYRITMRNNTIVNASIGIHVAYVNQVSDCELYYNTVIQNSDTGIMLGSGSSGCTIVNNSIGWNGINAQDEGLNNAWDDGHRFGNLYGDYKGEVTYEIHGSANSIDHYPRKLDTTPPIIEDTEDFVYESGSNGNWIYWHVIESHPDNFLISKDDTLLYVADDWNGSDVLFSVDGLSLGVHNYTLVVYDTCNNNASSTVKVSVVDTINPVVSSLGDIQFEAGTTGHNLTWTLQDPNPFSYEVFMNSTLITSGIWNSTGETVTITLDDLNVGTHLITITITDLAGNEASDIVIVSILPKFPLFTVLGIGIGSGVIFLLIVFVKIKKK